MDTNGLELKNILRPQNNMNHHKLVFDIVSPLHPSLIFVASCEAYTSP